MPDLSPAVLDRQLSRRRMLGLAAGGAALAGLVAAGCRPSKSTSPACVLTPEMTEGPYYLSGQQLRSDITEGRPGLPLALLLTVVSANGCTPIEGALVDLWHADAAGTYSGVQGNTDDFLRGIQATNANGVASFTTIYPGWYQGRATHMHVKVHRGGNTVHTGQLFFDEAANDAVYANAPYNAHTGTRTLNSQDGIYQGGGAQSIVQLSPAGSGLLGTLTMGVT